MTEYQIGNLTFDQALSVWSVPDAFDPRYADLSDITSADAGQQKLVTALAVSAFVARMLEPVLSQIAALSAGMSAVYTDEEGRFYMPDGFGADGQLRYRQLTAYEEEETEEFLPAVSEIQYTRNEDGEFQGG